MSSSGLDPYRLRWHEGDITLISIESVIMEIPCAMPMRILRHGRIITGIDLVALWPRSQHQHYGCAMSPVSDETWTDEHKLLRRNQKGRCRNVGHVHVQRSAGVSRGSGQYNFKGATRMPSNIPTVRKIADNATVLNNLGLLAELAGRWHGTGFNLVARPDFEDQTNLFLELNLTSETTEFTPISSSIPNRGFAQPDIELFGLTYLVQISDATTGGALHIEPGSG